MEHLRICRVSSRILVVEFETEPETLATVSPPFPQGLKIGMLHARELSGEVPETTPGSERRGELEDACTDVQENPVTRAT